MCRKEDTGSRVHTWPVSCYATGELIRTPMAIMCAMYSPCLAIMYKQGYDVLRGVYIPPSASLIEDQLYLCSRPDSHI